MLQGSLNKKFKFLLSLPLRILTIEGRPGCVGSVVGNGTTMRGKLFELKSIVEAVAMDESRLTVTWEADILHHIISFFICPNLCLVDGEALRSCSLVSRRWKRIVYSPAIWAFLAGGEESRKDEACAVSMSLQIRETVQASVPRSPRESMPSMIGFLNLGRVQRRSTENTSTWLVLHRATMRRYVISVPKDEEKTNEMIRELFEAHHVQEERFLRATSNSNIIRRFRCFPRGVYIRDGRLIRWYDDEPYSIYSGDIIQQKGNQECNRLNSDLHLLPTNENQDLDNSISHLLSLEGATSPIDISRNHARMDCWATLVDWIIEIVVRVCIRSSLPIFIVIHSHRTHMTGRCCFRNRNCLLGVF